MKKLTFKKANIVLNIKIILISLTASQPANADVNMKDASFFKTWVDHTIRRDRRDFKVRRKYKSRSLFRGLFGFGWCSNLEKSLQFLENGQIQLNDCEGDSQQVFAYDLTSQVYYNINKRNDFLKLRSGSYTRYIDGHRRQSYSKSGFLTSSSEVNEIPFEISYDSQNRINRVKLFDGSTLHVQNNSFGRIARIIYPDKNQIEFHYQNDDLNEVLKDNKLSIHYAYDELHNLTRVDYKNGTFETLDYDTNRDWITQHSDTSGCTEKYKYIQNTDSSQEQPTQTSTLSKKCGKQIIKQEEYRFWYTKDKNSQTFLQRVWVKRNDSITSMQFDPKTGAVMATENTTSSAAGRFGAAINKTINPGGANDFSKAQ